MVDDDDDEYKCVSIGWKNGERIDYASKQKQLQFANRCCCDVCEDEWTRAMAMDAIFRSVRVTF
jgi:hypothetical protein